MAQSYLPAQADSRTFADQQSRLLDDLNRPDLANIVIVYLQDAMRFFQRTAFFFSEVDNRAVPGWQASTMYPLGSTIQQSVAGTTYAFVAMSDGTQQSGTSPPGWTAEPYEPMLGSAFYEPPPVGEEGITQDGAVLWANIGPYQPRYHTQLTTVPQVNEYIPPIDWVAPYLVQITTANMRLTLIQIPFSELSAYDILQPAPVAAYPRFYAWWRRRFYLWVYPSGFYPVTLNYSTGPGLAVQPTDSNYWTTEAERLIRKFAQAAISREILYDTDAAQLAMSAATEELAHLKTQASAQLGYRIPAWDW